jgi:carbamate kinase
MVEALLLGGLFPEIKGWLEAIFVGLLVLLAGVVDKDLAAEILAKEVAATTLLILTDVKKVQRGYGSFYPEDIDRMTVDEAQALLKRGEFGAGSMGPKIEAAVGFVRGGGAMAVIADLEDATDALRGEAGTVIVPRPDPNAG